VRTSIADDCIPIGVWPLDLCLCSLSPPGRARPQSCRSTASCSMEWHSNRLWRRKASTSRLLPP